MPKAKVRFGLVPYTRTDSASGREYEDRAFRGMTIELSQEEYDRYLKEGAVVAANAELDAPGRLLALSATASDEEILNWALAATPTEVEVAATANPMLASRLRSAGDYAKQRADAYNEHLGGLVDAAERGATRGASDAAEREPFTTPTGDPATAPGTPPAPASHEGTGVDGEPIIVPGATETPASGTVPGPEGTTDAAEAEYFDGIVKGNRDAVTKFIAENPQHASKILEAENRRAAIEEEQPRVSVVRAVQAAAGHTA